MPAQASAEEPTSEQEAVTTFTEPRQFDRSKIVPCTSLHGKQTKTNKLMMRR